jgi:hypothetical protein
LLLTSTSEKLFIIRQEKIMESPTNIESTAQVEKPEVNSFRQSLSGITERIEKAFHKHPGAETEKQGVKTEDGRWTKEGFSIEDEIRDRQGPLIEIAGPTDYGFELVDLSKLDKKVFVSNISPGCPLYDDVTGEFLCYTGQVDFQADAQNLPFRESGIGILFASCLPKEIRNRTIQEAKRVLEDGGLLVWQGGTDEDIESAKKIGLEPVEYSKHLNQATQTYSWNVIFKKNEAGQAKSEQ